MLQTKQALLIMLLINLSFSVTAQTAPYILTLFIRPLWEKPNAKKFNKDKIKQTLNTPGKLECSLLKNEQRKCKIYSGIYTSYAGYSAVTDDKGQVIFPRYTIEPELYIVVTQSIRPIPEVRAPGTIHHFEITHPERAKIYKAELKEDLDTEIKFWNIEQKEFKDQAIPRNTLIIFANPKHIIIPTGAYLNPINLKLNQENSNLVLPDIYATRKITSPLNSLRFLKVNKFFTSVKKEYKYYPELPGYNEKISTTAI